MLSSSFIITHFDLFVKRGKGKKAELFRKSVALSRGQHSLFPGREIRFSDETADGACAPRMPLYRDFACTQAGTERGAFRTLRACSGYG